MRCHRGVRQRVVFVEVDVRPEADHDLDVFADQPIQHHPHVGHHHIQVERRRGDDLLAAEGQQLARQLRGANGGQPGVTIGGFQQAMTRALGQVDASLADATRLQREVQLDNPTASLEQTMVAMQKAQIGFQATLQVRNRLVQAYSDVMNMQV